MPIKMIAPPHLPKCKFCGFEVPYWVFGMAEKDHCHDDCRIKDLVSRLTENFEDDLRDAFQKAGILVHGDE